MDNDRALIFALRPLNNPKANTYDLYKYEFETGRIKRLTQTPIDEKYPDWIKGVLPVSPHGNLPTQWDEKKQTLSQ